MQGAGRRRLPCARREAGAAAGMDDLSAGGRSCGEPDRVDAEGGRILKETCSEAGALARAVIEDPVGVQLALARG